MSAAAAAYDPGPDEPYARALHVFQTHHDLIQANGPGLPEAQLAEAYRDYQLHWRRSASKVARHYAAPADVDDVLQEAALTLWTKIRRGALDPSRSSFHLYRQAVVERGIDRLRRRKLPTDQLSPDDGPGHPDQPRPLTPEETVLGRFDAHDVLELCERSGCSDRETDLIVLRYVGDLDWDSVLHRLNQTPPPIQRPAMQNKHRSAKIRIRDYLTARESDD